MKQSGFKQPTFEEAIAKKKIADQKRKERAKAKPKTIAKKPKKKKKVKYPGLLGVSNSRRYTGYKGTLWTIFSMYTRKRDFIKYNGRCVSCPRVLEDWKLGDAGHYVSVSRGNNETLFDEKNVHLQCKKCNNPTWTPDASIPFAVELDRRLGPGTAADIFERSQKYSGAYTELELMREIARYKQKFDTL